MNEENLIAEDNKILIGKRARFKEREDYVKKVWNKEGVIVTSERTKYLYLEFDDPVASGFGDGAVTEALVICKGSIDLI